MVAKLCQGLYPDDIPERTNVFKLGRFQNGVAASLAQFSAEWCLPFRVKDGAGGESKDGTEEDDVDMTGLNLDALPDHDEDL